MCSHYQGELSANEIKTMLKTPIVGFNELEVWLKEALNPSKVTPTISDNNEPHDLYRLFKLGNATSILRIHPSKNLQQTRIWFYDILGRPAPEKIKKTVTHTLETIFAITFGPDNPVPFFDLYEKSKSTILANTFIVNNELPPIDKELHAIKKLMQEQVELKDLQPQISSKVGLFHTQKPLPLAREDIHETKQKIPLK